LALGTYLLMKGGNPYFTRHHHLASANFCTHRKCQFFPSSVCVCLCGLSNRILVWCSGFYD